MKCVYASVVYLLCLTQICLVTGCNKSNRAAVSGAVTLDGKPVEGGRITFLRVERGAKANEVAEAKIENGQYSIPAAAGPAFGKNRVEIHWIHKTGKPSLVMPGAMEIVELVPKQYNNDSTLSVDVKSGQNTLDFKLQK
jgi:hypothetical protein